MPPSRPGRTRRPSQLELDRILASGASAHPLLPLIVRFAIATALRLERVLGVRTSNIKAIGAGKFAILFARGAERTKRTGVVPITPEIEGIILEALRHAGHDGCIELAHQSDIALFPVGTNVFSHAWRGLLKKLEIHDLRFHDLRHEATSRLFERGLMTAEVMSITGHSTNDMVDRYAHYSSLLVLDRMQAGTETQKESVTSPIIAALSDDIEQFIEAGGDTISLRGFLTASANRDT